MENTYDVAIIGSGIAGTMLGAILAKEGVKVAIIDAGTHPRFAVGESMVPESAVLLKILANRYAIPELAYPGELNSLIKHVGSSSAGIKLAFSFAWNGKHQEHNPLDVVSTPVIAPEAHLFRQDVDAYYLALAARLGATIKQQARIQDIEETADGLILNLGREQLSARYVVDAAGYRSPIADKYQLRQGAREMQARTRSIFTHMTGVKLYEDVIASTQVSGSPTPLAQSTLHHMFKGGWLWIIPFNNHPHSTNPLCSIGLQLDIDEHGPAGDPEVEFKQFLEDHPSVARHFEGAARVREWTVAPRLNYTSRESVGDRYCLLGHAVGFVDPLFSRGLVNTFESIARVAPKILKAVKTDVWRKEDFYSYQDYSLEVVKVNDRLVANSFTAFDSFPLWNAWFRVWISGSYIGVLRFRKILSDYLKTGDNEALEQAFETATYAGHLSIESPYYEALFEAACTAMEAYAAGQQSEAQTIEVLQRLFEEQREHLPIDFADFSNRFVSRASQEFADSLLKWANDAPGGLKARFDRGNAPVKFDFLDSYRYGDRLQLAAEADAALHTYRAR